MPQVGPQILRGAVGDDNDLRWSVGVATEDRGVRRRDEQGAEVKGKIDKTGIVDLLLREDQHVVRLQQLLELDDLARRHPAGDVDPPDLRASFAPVGS